MSGSRVASVTSAASMSSWTAMIPVEPSGDTVPLTCSLKGLVALRTCGRAAYRVVRSSMRAVTAASVTLVPAGAETTTWPLALANSGETRGEGVHGPLRLGAGDLEDVGHAALQQTGAGAEDHDEGHPDRHDEAATSDRPVAKGIED
ncbi:MAG: hypothetical protein IPH27_11340 [Actinomycetales bacterium]|nr:hypothetical protein [Candidatus Phosphoribacter baldrii]